MAAAAKKNNEIESLVATLAGRQQEAAKPSKRLTGNPTPQNASTLIQTGARVSRNCCGRWACSRK